MSEVDRVYEHRHLTARRVAIVVGLCVVAAVAFVMSNMVGAISLTPSPVISGIVVPSSLDEQTHTVLWGLRLPVAVMALLIGVSLSLAGAEMQRPFWATPRRAVPLGIPAGAAFGDATAIVLGWQVVPNPQLNLAVIAWISCGRRHTRTAVSPLLPFTTSTWPAAFIVLHHGEILAQGVPSEVITPELIEQVYAVKADILHHCGEPIVAAHAVTKTPTMGEKDRKGICH